MDGEENRENVIAWIKTNLYCDTDNIKYDLKELSHKVGFGISKFEVDSSSERGATKKVIRVYSDTHSEIPEENSSSVREWLEKINWSPNILDVGLTLERDKRIEKFGGFS